MGKLGPFSEIGLRAEMFSGPNYVMEAVCRSATGAEETVTENWKSDAESVYLRGA